MGSWQCSGTDLPPAVKGVRPCHSHWVMKGPGLLPALTDKERREPAPSLVGDEGNLAARVDMFHYLLLERAHLVPQLVDDRL